MNQNNTPSVARQMETLSNLFYLMVGLSLLAFAWIYLNIKLITPNIIFSVPAYRPVLHGLILLSSLGLLIYALLQYRRRLQLPQAITAADNLSGAVEKKVSLFRAASLKMYLLLTASTFLIIGGFYLSAEPAYAVAYSVLVIVYSLHRPITDRLTKDMKMNKEEREYYYQVVKEERTQHQQ